jgi:hypothetical protein
VLALISRRRRLILCRDGFKKGNVRLQEMMAIMAEERGGRVFATDERSVLHDTYLQNALNHRETGSASTTAL